MDTEIVVAMYRPKEGNDARLRQLIARHVPLLRKQGLATDRPVLLLRSRQDGTYLEIFEWVSADAAVQAHEDETVAALWTAMEDVASFRTLGELVEAARPFPHFEVVEGLTT